MNIQKTKAFKIILPVIMGVMVSGAVMAKPHQKCERSGHGEPRFERLIDRLDLTEEQQVKAEAIFDELKQNRKGKKERRGEDLLMTLDPESPDYLDKVTVHADKVSANMKTKIIEMAKAKQALYSILNEEQKQKLEKKKEKHMKKMEKRMNH